MPTKRPGQIEIVKDPDGNGYEVRRNRTVLLSGPTIDEDFATHFVQKIFQGEHVYEVDTDGYRTNVTRRFERRAKRRP